MGPPASFQDGARQKFTMEGGPSVLRETFVSQDCPYFKIVVEFQLTIGGPPQSGRNRQSLEALRAIQCCELGARQAAEKSVGNPSSAAIGLDGIQFPISRVTGQAPPVFDLNDYRVRRYICHRLPLQFSDDSISPVGRHLACNGCLDPMNWNTNGG
jgi:hypothetical protein